MQTPRSAMARLGANQPVGAFWSLTMYDAKGFQIANPVNRFAIGDRDALEFNADGSLDLYIQNENPGSDNEANRLRRRRAVNSD